MFKACIGLNCARQIDWIDRRGCQLTEIPDDIYRHESYLEELLLDSNNIQELPPKLFRLTNLRKLTLSENDVMRLPPMIANYSKLLELDISKNCIEEIPSNLQFCRSLSFLDFSCNPLLRIPDCVANITSLTHLFMNDIALPALPREIGNLQNLIVLEARENLLRRIPLSIGELKRLQRLDLGNNEIEALPSSFGFLHELTELWLDTNCLSLLPEELSNLRKLTVLDVTKNKLERLPKNFACLENLSDLHASENCIEELPNDFGCLKRLTQLKLDLNHLQTLPESIGDIPNLTEAFLFENMLESVPSSLFTISSMEMLNLDRNHLSEIPSSVGKCKSLHILSLRENDVTSLPEEIGQLTELRVLDVSGNRISHLPLGLSNLNLDALWISGNQLQPLVSLQQVPDPENSDKRVLTCQYLPQKGQYGSELDYDDISDLESEEGTLPLPRRRATSLPNSAGLSVAFEPGTAGLPPPDETTGGKLVRFPTPFRKELKNRHKRPKLDARPRNTVFRKGSMDDLTIHAVDLLNEPLDSSKNGTSKPTSPTTPSVFGNENDKHRANLDPAAGSLLPPPAPLSSVSKTHGVINLSAGYLAAIDDENNKGQESINKEPSEPKTKLQTIEVVVDLIKDPSRGLGFSIAGGKGSTPAYEDVDESIFITRIIRGGVAEKDGRLRLGDKVLSVNNQDMIGATHMQAVTALRNTQRKCVLKLSREVLIVLPEDGSIDTDSVGMGVGSEGGAPASVERSLESLTPSTPAKSVVTEASTGQRVKNDGTSTRETDSEQNGNEATENGNEVTENGTGNGNEADPLSSSLDSLLDSEHEIEKKKKYFAGEALLLDCDRESTPVDGRGQLDDDPAHINDVSVDVVAGDDDELEIDKVLDEDPMVQLEEGEKDVPEIEEDRRSSRSDSGLETPNFLEEVVLLDRSIPTLGMSIVGGIDYSSKIFGCGQPGIYISKISEGGSAAATGKLKMGDKILKVNGTDMECATHEEAVMCLVSQEGNIELHIRHEPPPPGIQDVTITKGGNKLGVSIKGGGSESLGNPFDPSDEGIFISKISSGGMAEADGRLQVGHRILEVDGSSLLGASHVEAVHVLRNTGDVVRLTVCDGYGLHSRGLSRDLVKGIRAGSMDLLDQPRNKVNAKRTFSTASSDALRKVGRTASTEDSGSSEFARVLADLTKYQEIISAILPSKDSSEDNKREEGPVEISVVAEVNDDLDKDTLRDSIEQLEEMSKASTELIEVTQNNNMEDNSNNNNLSVLNLRTKTKSDELARQRAEKQEELKSIISEVFSDLDNWDMLTKLSDLDTPKQEDDDSTATPPSASELSIGSPNNPELNIAIDVPMEIERKEEERERDTGNKDMGVVIETMDVQASSVLHASSVPPTPTHPPSQREWSVERPTSAQGIRIMKPTMDTIQVQLSHKPANLKAPEKLSFKDKLALHQRKVSKEGEDGGTRSKRQSWAPGHAPHSSSSSPAASPTHKLFSSSSVGTPPVLRVKTNSMEGEEKHLNRHTLTLDSQSTESSSPPTILTLPSRILPIMLDSAHPNIADDTIESPTSDPPLTDTPTSLCNDIDDFRFSQTPVNDADNEPISVGMAGGVASFVEDNS